MDKVNFNGLNHFQFSKYYYKRLIALKTRCKSSEDTDLNENAENVSQLKNKGAGKKQKTKNGLKNQVK